MGGIRKRPRAAAAGNNFQVNTRKSGQRKKSPNIGQKQGNASVWSKDLFKLRTDLYSNQIYHIAAHIGTEHSNVTNVNTNNRTSYKIKKKKNIFTTIVYQLG